MLKSIRWTLQFWHAGILLLALATFGTALYLNQSRTVYSEVDKELAAAARVFAEPAVGPHPASPSLNPGDMRLAMAEAPSGGAVTDAVPTTLAVPSPEPERLSNTKAVKSWLSGVSRDCLRQTGWDDRDQPYFSIWGVNGSVILQSTHCPAIVRPVFWRNVALGSLQSTSQPLFRTRDSVREAIVSGPLGSTILIGQSIQRQEASLQSLRMSLLGTGAAVLAVGLIGGFMFSGKAIRPIRLISDTAKLISGSDLSRRIDIRGTQSELGSLAETLNETFDRLESEFVRQRQFTADASHELRTPLSVIHAQCELALTKSRTPDEYRSAIESSLRASTRMKSLVESLLVLARADSGGLDLTVRPFDLKEAAQECLAMLAPIARQKNVKLICEGEDLTIHADRASIFQVITNLVSNAIRYNLPDGLVRVKISEKDGEASMEVEDNGIGIALTDQARVFQRFFRADNARSRESGGSGLGLAICHSIVRAHEGTISFASSPRIGTKFTVQLPILGPRNKSGCRDVEL